MDGVGDILGLTIALEIGDIRRFPRVGNFSSYCRCVDSSRLSNGKKKGDNNRKNGTSTYRGPLSKPLTALFGTTRPPTDFINESVLKKTARLRPRLWPINLLEPLITCYGNGSRLSSTSCFGNGLNDGDSQGVGWWNHATEWTPRHSLIMTTVD